MQTILNGIYTNALLHVWYCLVSLRISPFCIHWTYECDRIMQKVVCLKKYFPNQQQKEHRRPHAAAPANNDWLDFPVEWRGHTIGVMSHKPQEQSLNNQSKRRATTTKTHITENNIKSLCLNVINFWYHTIY